MTDQNPAEVLREAATAMREQHGPEHVRHLFWSALADWLDSVAAIVEADPHAAESCGCVEAEGYHHAVNVTRAYLGVSDG